MDNSKNTVYSPKVFFMVVECKLKVNFYVRMWVLRTEVFSVTRENIRFATVKKCGEPT
jgi:hypothetical protein